VQVVGNSAFRDCSALTYVLIDGEKSYVGSHTFYGCNKASIFMTASQVGDVWSLYWNSGYRPVFMNSKLDEDGIVSSVIVADGGILNVYDANESSSSKVAEGKYIIGWASTSGATEIEYSYDDIKDLPAGTVLYAVYSDKPIDILDANEFLDTVSGYVWDNIILPILGQLFK
jgi:hypothetical protein